jgi:GDPmannose 4,6-dehydratase
MKRALITGITGQDGRYMAEFLGGKGYHVFGLVRGQANPKAQMIQDENPSLELVEGDLQDLSSLIAAVEQVQPDEVYNLGAISFVQLSFKQPELTADITGLGVLRMLEAIRVVGGTEGNPIRFYQASSSEMFGKVRETPQNEQTPFHPRSPYGVAKVFGHYTTVNYREAYGLHASSGICFNHESIPGETPVVVRENGYIDVVPISELVPHEADHTVARSHMLEGGNLEVWDGEMFTRCTARSANWHEGQMLSIHGRGGVIDTTPDHVVFIGETEKPARDVVEGDALRLALQPWQPFNTSVTEDEAWLLGILAAEGSVLENGRTRVTCADDAVLAETAHRWERVTAGATSKGSAPSAFSKRWTPNINLLGSGPYRRMLRHELYTSGGHKRVPKRILNADPDVQRVFLSAYNLGDGLRAGHGIDQFKSFRTTSPTLAAGLVWLARTTLGRRVSLYRQPGALGGGSSYLINLSSSLNPGRIGAHLRKPQREVRKIERSAYCGWTYDLATESRRFAAGVGLPVIHNSPRRGLEFVTRKVTNSMARIKLGLQDKITLGNLDSSRDWGYAGDYVEAMWLMTQQPEPGDYVIAMGETHTNRELLEVAARVAGFEDWRPLVQQDERFMRPAEVDILTGDASKARQVLGWRPRVSFEELVQMMYANDLKEEQARAAAARR